MEIFFGKHQLLWGYFLGRIFTVAIDIFQKAFSQLLWGYFSKNIFPVAMGIFFRKAHLNRDRETEKKSQSLSRGICWNLG
jgi:hypothetical protein